MKRLEEKDIAPICQTISAGLLSSVEASYQLDGISDKQNLLHHMTRTQINHWQRAGEVWVIGDNQGVLAGHYGTKETTIRSLLFGLSLARNVLSVLSKEDKARLISNLKKADGAEDIKWRKQVCNKGAYFYIDLVVVDGAQKGSGMFRRLMEPILSRTSREGIPILLDTHDSGNVPIYQHFGFELIQEHRAKGNQEMVQYSMMKRP